MSPLNILLIFVPATVIAEHFHAGPVVIFGTACLGIVPLAHILGVATEHISERVGPGLGGFLNATFGNATELIIGMMALLGASELVRQSANPGPDKTAAELLASADQLIRVVQASITGSIIGNLLFILGLAFLIGGIGRERQRFSPKVAEVGNAMMTLAVAGLMAPSIIYWLDRFTQTAESRLSRETFIHLSEEVSVVLLIIYALSLLFSFKTHKHLYRPTDEAGDQDEDRHAHIGPLWSMKKSMVVLFVATLFIAFISEILVGSLEAAGKEMGLNPIFMGLVIVAMVGNAAEHASAVIIARRGNMDLALNIAMGSSMQIALLLAPALVLASTFMEKTMTLVFSPLEVASVGLAVAITTVVNLDGESNWLEGAQLLSVYIILALAFYHAF